MNPGCSSSTTLKSLDPFLFTEGLSFILEKLKWSKSPGVCCGVGSGTSKNLDTFFMTHSRSWWQHNVHNTRRMSRWVKLYWAIGTYEFHFFVREEQNIRVVPPNPKLKNMLPKRAVDHWKRKKKNVAKAAPQTRRFAALRHTLFLINLRPTKSG